jgi:hypothetical protein
MIRLRLLKAVSASTFALALTSGTAQAIQLPDVSACSNGNPCFNITNSGSGIGIKGTGDFAGVWAVGEDIGMQAHAEGIGVLGIVDGSGTAVQGESLSGPGVHGISGSWGGVIGQTGSTTAAAVSGWSPSASGVAFYGIGGIQITGSVALKAGGGWGVFSDARIKKDVKPLDWGLDHLRRIRPVAFKYNGLGGTEDDGRQHIGVVAQELEKMLPEMVTSRRGRLHNGDAKETDIKVVDPSAFTYVLINAVKEQQEIIERQEARLAALERARGPLSASFLSGGVGAGLAIGLLPLAFVALRRRKSSTNSL